jgi:DNA-binding transcriptional LysR family regulator
VGVLPPTTPDLISLDLLRSVAELGSFGRAARRHTMTQPAVSARMRLLERRLGVTLFERGPTGTRLSPEGVRIAAAVDRVLVEVDAMNSTAAALRRGTMSRVQVAASLTIAEYLLPSWIRVFTGQSPDLALSLDVVNSATVIARVVAGDADLGFVEGIEEVTDGIDSVVVGHDRLVVVVATTHPWASLREGVAGADIAASDIVTREPGSGTREVLEAALAPWGGVRSSVVLGSTGALLGAARRGGGPVVLSEIAVADDVAGGRLIVVPTRDVDLSRSFRAVWRRDVKLGPTARRLLDVAVASSLDA